MKNLLFGILTMGLLLGISAVVVSPELTDFFVDEREMTVQSKSKESNKIQLKPDQILKQTGSEWNKLSYREQLEFTVNISNGLKSRDMDISQPQELLVQINTYFENNAKDDTIEKALMKILTEN
ncbi:hypothetical protein [Pseudalkalibacillus berkeleyi]|uniref:DUF3679 domain-containing protein n=1 Tax=Pseudalkalibacillus berkeleyi TaxID=1069813 RepID=A0ABS9GYR1_9BACL|nr:hypothetical protein [Pseudalkalibacillus berkeleyi]MCF6136784.1 hypothetical protein [Pseudalkalibacillus berkeleyi]